MTLDTRIVLKNPDVSPEAVLAFVNAELLHAEAPLRADRSAETATSEWEREYYQGRRTLANRLGQGLMAIAEISVASPLGLITAPSSGWLSDASPDPEWEEYEMERAPLDLVTGSMLLSFDTGYGFHSAGAGCEDLHAYFITRLFEAFGPLAWQNEFTGEWHLFAGPDDLTPLRDFGDPDRGAAAVAAEPFHPAPLPA